MFYIYDVPHWLPRPISECIEFRIAIWVWRCHIGSTPVYLRVLVWLPVEIIVLHLEVNLWFPLPICVLSLLETLLRPTLPYSFNKHLCKLNCSPSPSWPGSAFEKLVSVRRYISSLNKSILYVLILSLFYNLRRGSI